VLPEVVGHLGESLGAEVALPGVCLGAVEGHPLHFPHIELQREKKRKKFGSGSASIPEWKKVQDTGPQKI